MHSHGIKKIGSKIQKPVLILVVMEDALAQICVDGKDIDAVVLILVVMEDALALYKACKKASSY